MLRITLLALAFLVSAPCVRAMIGDDLTQLRAAYGSAASVGNQMLFQHDGYSIAVYFDSMRSAMEIFVRDGSKANKTTITQDDIDAILKAEGAGQEWKPVQTRSGQPTWLRADNKLIARFNPNESILTVMVNSK